MAVDSTSVLPDDATIARTVADVILGPATAALLQDRVVMTVVLSDMRNGRSVGDAVLRAAFHALRGNPAVADEFFEHFHAEMCRSGYFEMRSVLKRTHDPEDFAQSVMAALWGELDKREFETRPQFLRYLKTKLHWKVNDKEGGATCDKRREQDRVGVTPSEAGARARDRSPSSAVDFELKRQFAFEWVESLPADKREVMRLYLQGLSYEEIGGAVDAKADTVRKRIERIFKEARGGQG